ncbi:MAG: hypothetical protein WCW93_03840, partial [Candidatus Paceibacterota bacterium]
MAARTFGSIFGTNPQHAHQLESEGKWEAYKKSHVKHKTESKEDETETLFSSSGLEFKEEGGEFYVEGFISDPTLDLGA